MTQSYSRRAFLGRSGITLAGVGLVTLGGSTLLAACGSDDDDDAEATGDKSGGTSFGTLDYQLSWIKNVEFAGAYIAVDKGYWTDAGFTKVNLIAGGPNVQQDAVVQAGRAFCGLSSPDITASAINEGADLVIVAAQYQKNPFSLMSLADNPIETPEDMYGKKIGVQATNESVWNGFIEAAGLDASQITKVPVQFDPQGLVNGEADGWFSYITNEPVVLEAQGIEVVNFLLNDNGYPYVAETMMVKRSVLEDDRDKLKAVLIGDLKGWADSLADPEAGAKLAVEEFGKDQQLDLEVQIESSIAQNALIDTPDTKANGLFTITEELQTQTIESLAAGGIDITVEKLFDLTVLAEVLDENPDLKG